MNLPKQFLLKKKSGPKQNHTAKKSNFHHVILVIIIFFKASKSRAYAQFSVGKLPKKEKKTRKTFSIKFD